MKIIGHRGARGLAAENTLASLDKGMLHHVDELEIDVRVTADDIVVVTHDRKLLREADAPLVVKSSAFASLLAVKPDLPRLEEAIRHVSRRTPLRIEVKRGVPTGPIIAIIERFLAEGWQPGDFSFSSFDQKILLQLHRAFPDITIAVNASFSSILAIRRAKQLGTKQLVMNRRFIWFGFVRFVSRRGYELTPYTINDPATAERWARYGLAGIVTDYPDRFR